ncbi:MAG: hypothetical protein NTW54_01790 [Bacteroidetes bacterium]|nr:hypothetical protein [Bacteroidota bacterium]
MAIYRFKCSIEDHDDLFRFVEVKSGSFFESLQNIILQAFGFDHELGCSFFMSDDQWRMNEEITSGKKTMKGKPSENLTTDSKLSKFIFDPHQKILMIYDYEKEWTFRLEMVNISVNPKEGVTYPFIFKSVGISPKQYNAIGVPNATAEVEDEFEFIKNQILVADEDEVGEDGFKETNEDGEEVDNEEDEMGEEGSVEDDN